MAAIRGVANLAEATETNEQASEVLLQAIFSASNLAIKKVAIFSYLQNSNNLDESIEYLKNVLPENEHSMITLDSDNVPELE